MIQIVGCRVKEMSRALGCVAFSLKRRSGERSRESEAPSELRGCVGFILDAALNSHE
jgi:hypothetical protein